MNDPRADFLKLVEQTLNFELLSAGDGPLPPGHTTGWRTLPSTVLSHITGSHMILELDEGPLKIAERAYCTLPGRHHCSHGVGGRCRWMHGYFTVLGGVNIFTFMSAPPVLSRRTSDRVARLNGELAKLNHVAGSIATAIRRKSLGFQLLVSVLDDVELHDSHVRLLDSAQRLSPALIFIRENLSRPIALAELARQLHLSPSRFNAVFRAAFGLSPRDYLQRERLQKAQELLIQSDLSIAEVGARAGWDNPFFFSRLFTKKCGQTPTEYRRHVRRGIVGVNDAGPDR